MKIYLCETRAPFGSKPQDVFELSPEYLSELIREHSEGYQNVSYELTYDEVRDGKIVHNGVEVPAGKRTYYLELDLKNRLEKRDAPKEPAEDE